MYPAEVGRGHDLDERYPGAVEIDPGSPVGGDVVEVLAGVLLHVDPDVSRIARFLPSTVMGTAPPTQMGSSYWEIWYPFGQVRIEVVLPRPDALPLDLASERETGRDRRTRRPAG